MHTIKTLYDLKKTSESQIKYALKATQNIVNDCIQESINEYYKEKVFQNNTSNIPEVYERTYKLLNSLVKTEIININGTFSCQVKINESYLNYHYTGTPGYFNLPATGLDILTWNNFDGSHGRVVDGDWKIWERAMQDLGGKCGIIALLKSSLRRNGISIK